MSEEATLDEFADDETSESEAESAQLAVESSRLEEYMSIIKGTKPNRVVDEQRDGSKPYLVVSTLTGEERKYTPDTDGPKATPQDTLMIMDGSKSGRVYRGEGGVIGSTMAAIRPEDVNSHYLQYFLESNFERLNSATKGSAVPHTDKDLLRSLEIPAYTLSEQRKIATVLYTVDQAIEKTREIIEQVNRVKNATAQDLFTHGFGNNETKSTHLSAIDAEIPSHWGVKSIDQISRRVTDGAHLTPDRSDNGYLLLSARNVRSGYLDLSDVDHVPESEYERLINKCNPEPGDILMSCSGMGLGRPCVVPKGLEFALVRSAALIKLKEKYVPEFVEQAIQFGWIQRQIQAYLSRSAQPNIFQGQIESIEIPIPPRAEQERISEVLSDFNDLVDTQSDYMDSLSRLKRGLMQDLLSGRVRTTDTNMAVPEEIAQHG